MRAFHVIAGLPRAGSTLLCNLLAQRPDVYVSSTSALPTVLSAVTGVLTTSGEVTADLVNVPDARERSLRVMRAIVAAWYADAGDRIVIDKSRAWSAAALTLRRLYPDAGVIAPVRDPRAIAASIERQHRASAEYGPHGHLWDRCSEMFAPGGLVGASIAGTEDLLRRQLGGVLYLAFDQFALRPADAMGAVEEVLGLDRFVYDFDNVVSVATDLDPMYRWKFPHIAAGRVAPPPGPSWQDVIGVDVAAAIVGRWPMLCSTFGFS